MRVEAGKAALRRPQEMAWERSGAAQLTGGANHAPRPTRKLGDSGAGTEGVGMGEQGKQGHTREKREAARERAGQPPVLAMQGYASRRHSKLALLSVWNKHTCSARDEGCPIHPSCPSTCPGLYLGTPGCTWCFGILKGRNKVMGVKIPTS